MFIKQKKIIAGRNPLIEALEAATTIDKILMYRQATGTQIARIKMLARENGIPIQPVPMEKLNQLTNVNHQGVIAFKSAVPFYALQDVIDFINQKGDTILFVMLDGITDVRNIGAIARTAVCCGAQALIVPQKGVAALGEDAMKSSAGALEKIHVVRVRNLEEAVQTLLLNGVSVAVSEMTATTNIRQIDWKIPMTVVMGSEDEGVSAAVSRAADHQFHIPMAGDFESLNVSVAAGMILYEAMMQRAAVS